MTHDIKALALAAIEARTTGDFKAIRAYEDAATPDRILQYRNEVLEYVSEIAERFGPNESDRRKFGAEMAEIFRSLKTKEPKP